MDSKKNAEMSIFCKIGRGDVSFWWDNWTVLGALANIVPGGRTSKNTKVQEFIHEGAWMRDKLMGKVSESTVNTIQKIKINVDKRDYPIWLLEKTGEFTCKSAWQNLRRKGCGTFTSSRIWHKQIPFKISFFMLRLLQARIPTDDVVNMVTSRCSCCTKHEEESINHLFTCNEIARHVWNYFCNVCAVKFSQGHVRHVLMNWWIAKANNEVHSTLLQCVPSVVCWDIWKSRCAAMFENKKMSAWHIIQQVSNLMTLIINYQFPTLQLPQLWIDKCKVIENLKHCIQFQAVIWRKPEMGWVNFNVDGCCKGNPGTTGGGGMIRNYNGEMIKAFAEFYGQGNNNLAEAKAMLYGVKLCCNCGFSKVIVESDSMLIVNLVNQRMKPPWQLTQIIEQIREVTETGNFLFVHIFREGNAIADHLAKLGESSKTFHIFNQVVSLPMKIRASLKLDQDNMPNFRFRQKKNQFTINDVTI